MKKKIVDNIRWNINNFSYYNLKKFGLGITIMQFMTKYLRRSNGKVAKFFFLKKNELILKWLKQNYERELYL